MRRNTLASVAIQRVGVRRGGKVLAFALQWGLVVQELKRRPTVEEYAEFWKVSNATAYREQAAWRETFPEFDTPSDYFAAMGLNLATDDLPSVYGMRLPKGLLDV